MAKWDWLAMIINGRSHNVSMSKGEDRESEKNMMDRFRLLSVN